MSFIYSLLTSSTNQAKTFSLNSDGKLIKSSLANPTKGYFSTHIAHTLADFATALNSVTSKQTIILGQPFRPDGTELQVGEKIGLTIKAKNDTTKIPRSKNFIRNVDHAGFMLFDLDGNSYGLTDIKKFIPELENVGAVVKPSSSSFIYDKNGNELIGDKGRHIYIPVNNLSDVPRIAEIFWGRMWLAGYGHFLISNGIHPMLLERGLFDKSVIGASERLAFEAAPILNDGLVQRNNIAKVVDGVVLDTRLITPLTDDELQEIAELKEAAKAKVRPEYKTIITKKKADFIASGKTEKDWESIKRRELPPDFEVITTQGKFKINELNGHHDGLTMADPNEPDYDGGNLTKAKFFWNNGNPKIYSQAHGGVSYKILKNEIQVEEIPCFFALDKPLPPELFVDVVTDKYGDIVNILPTLSNFKIMLSAYGISAVYDECVKSQQILIPDNNSYGHDLHNETCWQILIDLAQLNRIDVSICNKLPIVLSANTINPVKDWIFSKKWDGVSRINALCTLIVVDSAIRDLTCKVIKTWLIQCVAALDKGKIGCKLNPKAKAKYELVLVLQGVQGATKTTWFTNLLPHSVNGEYFSNRYIKDGSNLVLTSRDSIKQNVSCWINELGELDATFKKTDIAQLKAFCSNQKDILRLPYARTECEFQRATSFCGSVNDEQFLNDATGSRRFGVIKVKRIIPHNIDMQQLWAEIWELYASGHQWWLDKDTETAMQDNNCNNHQILNPVEDAILSRFDWDSDSEHWNNRMTMTDIYQYCFDKKPNKSDLNAIKPFLEKLGVRIIKPKNVQTALMPLSRVAR